MANGKEGLQSCIQWEFKKNSIWRINDVTDYFTGNKNREHTSLLTLQPFAFYQLGQGYYLRTAPTWIFNFVPNSHVIPLSIGLGKVSKIGKTIYNLFIEAQFSISHKRAGQPLTQIYAALNLQFL